MKKLICLILVLILALSVMTACMKDNKTNSEKEANVPVTSKSTAVTKENPEPPIVREPNQSLDFYLILNGTTNEESISYHTKDCPLLKNKEIQKITWEMVKTLEFRHCSKCNPPKYEGYVE